MDSAQRQAVASIWALGDYSRVARRLAPAADRLVDLAGPGEGGRAIDLAAGTGSVAHGLAARGWLVDACEISPDLISQARQHREPVGHRVTWHECSLDDMPVPDESFDVAASSFGLIFSPDPGAAVQEVRRCLRPGGLLAFSAWTPEGYMGQMTEVMTHIVPSPPGRPSAVDWGRREFLVDQLSGCFTNIRIQTTTLPWNFDSAQAAIDFYFTHSPAHIAMRHMAGDRADALTEAVRHHLEEENGPGEVRIDAEYLLVTARAE